MKMNKTKSPFGDIRESLGEEGGPFLWLSPLVGSFELIVNHIVFVKGEVFTIYFIEVHDYCTGVIVHVNWWAIEVRDTCCPHDSH